MTETTINPDAMLTPSADVLFTDLDDEKVLFMLETGDYANLNRQGGAIWEALAGGNSVNGVVEALCRRFDVTPEQCRADVATYCQKLIDGNLLVVD